MHLLLLKAYERKYMGYWEEFRTLTFLRSQTNLHQDFSQGLHLYFFFQWNKGINILHPLSKLSTIEAFHQSHKWQK